MKYIVCENAIFTLDNMSSIVIEDMADGKWGVAMDYTAPRALTVILYKSTSKDNCKFVLAQIVCQMQDGKDVIEVTDSQKLDRQLWMMR